MTATGQFVSHRTTSERQRFEVVSLRKAAAKARVYRGPATAVNMRDRASPAGPVADRVVPEL